VALGLSVVGWSMECLGAWIVLEGLGADVSLAFAAFAFALASIVGALSMLPGGLGLTEASLLGLLVQPGVPEGTAAAATLIIRAATLWFVAASALVVHATHRARTRTPTPDIASRSAGPDNPQPPPAHRSTREPARRHRWQRLRRRPPRRTPR